MGSYKTHFPGNCTPHGDKKQYQHSYSKLSAVCSHKYSIVDNYITLTYKNNAYIYTNTKYSQLNVKIIIQHDITTTIHIHVHLL